MAGQGATTIWELWNGDTAMNSGNHLMLVGDLITWFYENLAGSRPDPAQPGFKHIIMHPTPVGDLTYVKASHKLPPMGKSRGTGGVTRTALPGTLPFPLTPRPRCTFRRAMRHP